MQLTDAELDAAEIAARNAEIEHLPAFLRGEWIGIPSDTLDDLLATAAYDFALDHDDRKLVHRRTIALSPMWKKTDVVDAVMLFAYALEPVELSVSRLATAARYIGFSVLTPYAAAVCYHRFNSLKEKYTCKKRQTPSAI